MPVYEDGRGRYQELIDKLNSPVRGLPDDLQRQYQELIDKLEAVSTRALLSKTDLEKVIVAVDYECKRVRQLGGVLPHLETALNILLNARG